MSRHWHDAGPKQSCSKSCRCPNRQSCESGKGCMWCSGTCSAVSKCPSKNPGPVAGPDPIPNPDPANPAPNPTPDPVTNPVPNPIPDPVSNPAPNPTPGPGSNPAPDPGSNPTQDPGSNPIPDPVTNPTQDPTPAPACADIPYSTYTCPDGACAFNKDYCSDPASCAGCCSRTSPAFPDGLSCDSLDYCLYQCSGGGRAPRGCANVCIRGRCWIEVSILVGLMNASCRSSVTCKPQAALVR